MAWNTSRTPHRSCAYRRSCRFDSRRTPSRRTCAAHVLVRVETKRIARLNVLETEALAVPDPKWLDERSDVDVLHGHAAAALAGCSSLRFKFLTIRSAAFDTQYPVSRCVPARPRGPIACARGRQCPGALRRDTSWRGLLFRFEMTRNTSSESHSGNVCASAIPELMTALRLLWLPLTPAAVTATSAATWAVTEAASESQGEDSWRGRSLPRRRRHGNRAEAWKTHPLHERQKR